MNKVILIGNLTKDVELRTTGNGKSVASCSLATNKSYKDAQGVKQSVVQYHNLVIWQKSAEIFAQYLAKGSKVMVEGELQTRDYENKEEKKVYVTEIVVNNFEFLTPKQQGGQGDYSQPAPQNNYAQAQSGGGGGSNIQQNPSGAVNGEQEPQVNYLKNPPAQDEIKVANIPF